MTHLIHGHVGSGIGLRNVGDKWDLRRFTHVSSLSDFRIVNQLWRRCNVSTCYRPTILVNSIRQPHSGSRCQMGLLGEPCNDKGQRKNFWARMTDRDRAGYFGLFSTIFGHPKFPAGGIGRENFHNRWTPLVFSGLSTPQHPSSWAPRTWPTAWTRAPPRRVRQIASFVASTYWRCPVGGRGGVELWPSQKLTCRNLKIGWLEYGNPFFRCLCC